MRLLCFVLLLVFTVTTYAYECGGVINKNLNLTEDIVCDGNLEVAFYVIGNHIKINGNGHKITAPNAKFILKVGGKSVHIKNITLVGNKDSIGIDAYDSPGFSLKKSTIDYVGIGVQVFNENICGSVKIKNNSLKHNSKFGARVIAKKCKSSAVVKNNDFSYSGDYAYVLVQKKISFGGRVDNILTHSKNGIMLSGNRVSLRNIDFTPDQISGNPLMIYNSDKVSLFNLDVSGEFDQGIGIHLFDVMETSIESLISRKRNTGVKLAGKNYQMKSLTIYDSDLDDNSFTGLFLHNLDSAHLNYLGVSLSSISRNYYGKYLLMPVRRMEFYKVDMIDNHQNVSRAPLE